MQDTVKKTFEVMHDFIEETYDRLDGIEELTQKAEEAGIIGMDAFLDDIVASATSPDHIDRSGFREADAALAATAQSAGRPDVFPGVRHD